MKIEGKRVLITGRSSGIGLALARAVLGKSAKVIITGRRSDTQMIALNRDDPAAIDERFLSLTPALEGAVEDHSAL